MAKASDIPAAKLELYEKLVATVAAADRKGASMPYTSRNGHMFSFLDPEGQLSLRLPEAEREAFLAEHDTRLSEQHGRVMKEYVVVPESVFDRPAILEAAFAVSIAYIRTLKPKPTRRKSPSQQKTR